MSDKLSVGNEAPNFDLASTEDVVLMLRDEVPRMAVVLYFFVDPAAPGVRQDLEALADAVSSLKARRAVVLGVSPAKLEVLKQLQKELHLSFPLLHDDRDFASSYGIETSQQGEAEPALFLVDRDQTILWLANPVSSVTAGLNEINAILRAQPSQTYHYPSAVVNRIVDWWINKIRPSRVA